MKQDDANNERSMDLQTPHKRLAWKREMSHGETGSKTYEENLNSFVMTFWRPSPS